MILDKLNEFCDATSVAAIASTALVGNVIDLSVVGSDIGVGGCTYLVIRTTTEIITGGTAGTIQFQLASDAQAAIAIDGSATVHLTSPSFVTDDAAANSDALNVGGTIMVAELPYGTYERYLGILAVIGGQTVTAGAIDAFLTRDPAVWKAYADGANY